MSLKMICLDCENRFDYEGWDRSINCPKCESSRTCSAGSYDAGIGYRKDLAECKKKLNEKWGYGYGL